MEQVATWCGCHWHPHWRKIELPKFVLAFAIVGCVGVGVCETFSLFIGSAHYRACNVKCFLQGPKHAPQRLHDERWGSCRGGWKSLWPYPFVPWASAQEMVYTKVSDRSNHQRHNVKNTVSQYGQATQSSSIAHDTFPIGVYGLRYVSKRICYCVSNLDKITQFRVKYTCACP